MHADQRLKRIEGIDTLQRCGINDPSQSSIGVSASLGSETAQSITRSGRSIKMGYFVHFMSFVVLTVFR
jgi:hypothetical protein